MKNSGRYGKLFLRWGLLSLIFFGSIYSCANPSSSPTSPASTDTLQPSYTITIKPTEELIYPIPIGTHQPTVAPLKDIGWLMIEQVNIDRALTDLRKLTGEEPICNGNGCYTISNRQTSSVGLQWTKKYIYDELVKMGYSVEVQDWSHSGYSDQNIIAKKPGESIPGEEVYFVAHMDGTKKGLTGRYPAADDNASGVVDILELARILSIHSFSRTSVLLFSTGEEQGSLGVKSYIGQLSPEELSAIKYVVNIDMIGYDTNRDAVMELWHGEHAPSLALTQIISEAIKDYQINLQPKFVIGCG